MEASAFVPLYLTATGQNFMALLPCGLIQALPWFCLVFTNGNGLAIGIDRLLSAAAPIWYDFFRSLVFTQNENYYENLQID